ncbi:hypothetical protein OSB04_007328 [Centaurea solstitialis]|uniref:Uncharacterized protein n=1 Tax=Centaurea solstitialis TaxID=347529 RepID=A0AA38TJP4_9ASTR|nr:hypothetical protein OSB04_007328 [Centaurea solstitialis]
MSKTVSGFEVGTMALAGSVAGQNGRYSVARGIADLYSGDAHGPRLRVWTRDLPVDAMAEFGVRWRFRNPNLMKKKMLSHMPCRRQLVTHQHQQSYADNTIDISKFDQGTMYSLKLFAYSKSRINSIRDIFDPSNT